jgi:hypothetical protein
MRRALIGFLVAAGVVLVADIAIIVGLGTSSDSATGVWWLINFPSVPFVLCCAGAPPMGEAEIGPWDYMAVAISVIGSCVSWGLLGACIGWLTGSSPPKPPVPAPGAASGEQARQAGQSSSPEAEPGAAADGGRDPGSS